MNRMDYSSMNLFPRRPVSENMFTLECGTLNALEVQDFQRSRRWISQKLCNQILQPEKRTVDHYYHAEPPFPIFQQDMPGRSKTPEWSIVDFPVEEIESAGLFESVPTNQNMMGSRSFAYLESLSHVEIDPAELGNCLAICNVHKHLMMAYSTSSSANVLKASIFSYNTEKENELFLEEIDTRDFRLNDAIYQVEIAPPDGQSAAICLARTSKQQLHLVNLFQMDNTVDLSVVQDNVIAFQMNPHFEGEYCVVLNDGKVLQKHLDHKSCSTVGLCEHKTLPVLCEWDSHPKCLYLKHDNILSLYDMRSNQQTSLLSDEKNICCMQLARNGKNFFLYATEFLLKIVDLRMFDRPLLEWNHMLLDKPKYLDHIFKNNAELNNEVDIFLVGRQSNETIVFNAFGCDEKNSLLCSKEPPYAMNNVEDLLLWMQSHQPLWHLPKEAVRRALAPYRGFRSFVNENVPSEINIYLSDVGDLHYQCTAAVDKDFCAAMGLKYRVACQKWGELLGYEESFKNTTLTIPCEKDEPNDTCSDECCTCGERSTGDNSVCETCGMDLHQAKSIKECLNSRGTIGSLSMPENVPKLKKELKNLQCSIDQNEYLVKLVDIFSSDN
ncbi:hypothetical protein T4D_5630 [Trichinella pseudospiralis]|uniref:TATA box-binding protein-associated factor RNA polymerase I subunit C n=1 Tax=Trichinella pseudospiralis TaxID=6337 RepID=A0A0V1FWZ0_TRIPS|nr:hypothetical protein T4D_5630 [Trichinella pseudospiralis]